MTMTVKGFEKNNGQACVVVSIPVDELFNIPALSPILDSLTAPDVSGAILQDASAAPADVIKTRKPRVKKAAVPVEVAPAVTPASVVMPTYPGRKKAAPVAPAAPANNANSNAAKMQNHCAGYKVIPGQQGVKLMGISNVVENGKAVKKPFFFTKFCSCQVEAVVAKRVG